MYTIAKEFYLISLGKEYSDYLEDTEWRSIWCKSEFKIKERIAKEKL